MHEILHPRWSDRWSRDAPCCIPQQEALGQGRLSRPCREPRSMVSLPQSEDVGQAFSLALGPCLGSWGRAGAGPCHLGSGLHCLPFPSAWKKGERGALFFQSRLEVAGQQAARHCCSVLGGKNGLFCVGDLEAGLVTRMAGCRGACQVSPWSQAGVEGTPVGI